MGMEGSADSRWPLSLGMARALISENFAQVDVRSLEHLGSGWEFDAFVTADGWVFRFPRGAYSASLFEAERPVLSLVSRALPPAVEVPQVELIGRPSLAFPYRFAGHRLIRGVTAYEVLPEALPTLAQEIGAALETIHSIPADIARSAGVKELGPDAEGRGGWIHEGMERARELRGMDPVVDQAVEWLDTVSLPLPRFEGPLRFIHYDLCPEHLIVDPRTGQLRGILDWTDAILGDAARDFVFLVTWRGWVYAEEVLQHYRNGTDSGFRERLRFMARFLSVLWLAHGRSSAKAKHVEGVRHAFSSEAAR